MSGKSGKSGNFEKLKIESFEKLKFLALKKFNMRTYISHISRSFGIISEQLNVSSIININSNIAMSNCSLNKIFTVFKLG